jgi:hypothetical protein
MATKDHEVAGVDERGGSSARFSLPGAAQESRGIEPIGVEAAASARLLNAVILGHRALLLRAAEPSP